MPYGYGYGYYMDPTYILILIGVVISLWASAKVKTTYSKYSRVRSMSGLTGAQVADQILRANGIYDVRIEHVSGELTDHYDPKNRVLRLSDVVYNSTSVAALGVAAHECGHAVQDDRDYFPLRFRNALVPVANFGTQAAWPIILVGLLFAGSSFLINLGILLFSLGVLFQLVTLPVEFNASRRAIQILGNTGILYGDEIRDTKKVLSAAAMTYVAAAAASILSLLRLLILFGGRRNRD
ncbi:zinc metallopeptidase [Candidatus Merdisoma sp. HCP28S3_D10]|uniref:zinc metallopeptidase n=1 Tax=unclassified Candidatus Merdisoma TaxID=3099611 RepID=UPI003F8B5A80